MNRLLLTALLFALGCGSSAPEDAGTDVVFSPRGIALDADGNVYVTDRMRLYRFAPDGSDATILDAGLNSPQSLEFGTGALPCTDLYIATNQFFERRLSGTIAGASVPWH